MGIAAEKAALRLLASLFFIWGFITVINNTLLPHLKSVFDLNHGDWGPADDSGGPPAVVWVTLAALFVIAGGITLLQVAAIPYVAVVGPADRAPSRLNFVQAFNSLGTTLAPLFGGYLILGRSAAGTSQSGVVATVAERLMDARAVQLPYLIVAAVLLVLAVVIARCKLPDMGAQTRRASAQERRTHSLWHHRNLVLGVPAIFIYLIAEIGVSNLFISFVSQPTIANLTHEQASRYLFLLWGGKMVGRFAGSLMMRFIPGERVLAGFAVAALATMLVTCFAHGPLAMAALILVGLCHSIMFPTIFTLGIRGLGPLTEEGSGLLIMAIAGGALVIVQGWLADRFGLQRSFLLTAACELYVIFYARWGSHQLASEHR
jgi:FHS family L-fucose permease-like MFS transporter